MPPQTQATIFDFRKKFEDEFPDQLERGPISLNGIFSLDVLFIRLNSGEDAEFLAKQFSTLLPEDTITTGIEIFEQLKTGRTVDETRTALREKGVKLVVEPPPPAPQPEELPTPPTEPPPVFGLTPEARRALAEEVANQLQLSLPAVDPGATVRVNPDGTITVSLTGGVTEAPARNLVNELLIRPDFAGMTVTFEILPAVPPPVEEVPAADVTRADVLRTQRARNAIQSALSDAGITGADITGAVIVESDLSITVSISDASQRSDAERVIEGLRTEPDVAPQFVRVLGITRFPITAPRLEEALEEEAIPAQVTTAQQFEEQANIILRDASTARQQASGDPSRLVAANAALALACQRGRDLIARTEQDALVQSIQNQLTALCAEAQRGVRGTLAAAAFARLQQSAAGLKVAPGVPNVGTSAQARFISELPPAL